MNEDMTINKEMDFRREMLKEEQSGDPNSVYADSMRDEKIKNVIAQLNPELLLQDIEHRIRGEKKDPVTEQWIPISPDSPQISEKLVQNYISFLNVYLTQNNSLSNYSADEINNIMTTVIDYIKDDLSDNAEEYGLTKRNYITVKRINKILTPELIRDSDKIYHMKETPIEVNVKIPIGEEYTDYNEFNKIGHIVCQSTFSVLKQAQNGMLASRIFKALRVNETLNQGGKDSKLNFLKFW